MTRDDDFKRLVRARMAATDERYTTARAALLRGKESAMVPVTVEIRMEALPEGRAQDLRRRMEARDREDLDDIAVTLLERIQRTYEQSVMVLTEIGGSRSLPIWCGPVEATAIVLAQQGVETSRPLTHDLLRDVVSAMGTAREVRITELRGDVFYAELVVDDHGGSPHTVSCRPSDGVAFGVRAGVPIFVAEQLFPASA